MKQIFRHILTLVATATAITACVEHTESITGFHSDTATIEAAASGGEYNIKIRSAKEWTAVANSPWIMISPANGRGDIECIVKIDSAMKNDMRSTDINFSSVGEILHKVSVNQQGYAKSITPDEAERTIAASAKRADRWFETEITTNVDFEIVPEYGSGKAWLTVRDHSLNLDRGARPRTTRVKVEWKMNSDAVERTAKLHLRAKNPEDEPTTPSYIIVRQNAAPRIEDNRQGDSLAVVTIFEKLESWGDNGISTTESMQHWECVRLWEATDKSLPEASAVGRVRDLELSYFNTEEGIPSEIKHLKYLETLSLFGNVNTMLKSIEMGEEVCELQYLKDLRIAAFGLISLPANFINLGDTLETLDLNSNNFNAVPEVITAENFPKLKSLNLASCRRSSILDLRNASTAEKGIGMTTDMEREDIIKRMFLWESLEELVLSYNYIEGRLPDFKVGEDGIREYRADDMEVVERGDTLKWAVENRLPRILPNMKSLKINLNFMTGELPEWLLYHPRLIEWAPEVLIYPQQEKAIDSRGVKAGFSNTPTSREEYFMRYPLMRGRFEYNEEM